MNDYKWAVRLVSALTSLADPANPDRASLAYLRNGLRFTPNYTLARVGWLFGSVPDFALPEALLAAGLFAWVKGTWPQKDDINFGQVFGANLTLEDKQKREKRFVDLLDTDREDLPYKLRQAVTLMGQGSVPLDWVLLIRHLRAWDRPRRPVQRAWARGFWGAVEPVPDFVVDRSVPTQP